MFLLQKCGFNLALFCPPRLNPVADQHSDQADYTCSSREQLAIVANHAAMWRDFVFAASCEQFATVADHATLRRDFGFVVCIIHQFHFIILQAFAFTYSSSVIYLYDFSLFIIASFFI